MHKTIYDEKIGPGNRLHCNFKEGFKRRASCRHLDVPDETQPLPTPFDILKITHAYLDLIEIRAAMGGMLYVGEDERLHKL